MFVRLHRLFGLSLAAFLLVASLTGSFLVFQREIDAWLNPDLWRVSAPGPSLSPSEIAARVEAYDPRVQARWMPLEARPAAAYDVWVDWKPDRRTGAPAPRRYDQMFVDPVSGAINGTRVYGACCVERRHLVPFVYYVHSSLFMPGRIGAILLGIVALVWTLDSFIGFYLTLPRGGRFWRGWRRAWRIKRRTSGERRTFDLHRAGGLWAWMLLIIMGVSSVALTLEHEVVEPLVENLSPITPEPWEGRPFAPPGASIEPSLSYNQALALASAAATKAGFSDAPSGIYYAPESGLFGAMFGREEEAGVAPSWVYLDGLNGRVVSATHATDGTRGDVFMRLQLSLHAGRVLGFPTRVLALLVGVATFVLTITGVTIWWRRRCKMRPPHGFARHW